MSNNNFCISFFFLFWGRKKINKTGKEVISIAVLVVVVIGLMYEFHAEAVISIWKKNIKTENEEDEDDGKVKKRNVWRLKMNENKETKMKNNRK